jgi:hypothetical protein
MQLKEIQVYVYFQKQKNVNTLLLRYSKYWKNHE